MFFVLVDAIEVYKATTPHSHSPPPPITTLSFRQQAFIGWLTCLETYSTISMAYSFAAAVLVLLGIYEPRDFPPIFGRIRDLWSVRQYWGHV
jgi:hypothetical protein